MGRKKIKIEKITNPRQKMVSNPTSCGRESWGPGLFDRHDYLSS